MKKPELLAPAGEYAGLVGAVCAGADAVYLGGSRFSARALAHNFSDEELLTGIRFAHLHGRRIYLTLNTLIKEWEYPELCGFLKPLDEAGLDGVIVQDPGVLLLIRDRFPGLRIHASTQMAVTGVHGARWLQSQGVSRVVPARELSLKELVNIKSGTAGRGEQPEGIEIEAFIHGAMCYSYSGMCLMSAMLGGRSGNRGRCAGACRLPYAPAADKVTSRRREGGAERAEALPGQGHLLSLRDMCTLPVLQRLLRAEVIDSLKIEGRMKDPVYAAGVTSVYRKAIDGITEYPERTWQPDDEDIAVLKGLYLRTDLCDGYYFRHNGASMITVQTPGYVGSDEAVVREMRRRYLSETPRYPVTVQLRVRSGEPVALTLEEAEIRGPVGADTAEPLSVTVTGAPAEAARNRAATVETLTRQLDRFGESDFIPVSTRIDVGGDVFIAASAVNALRRRACEALSAAILRRYDEASRGNGSGTGETSPGQQTERAAEAERRRSGADGVKRAESLVTDGARMDRSAPGRARSSPGMCVSVERPEQLEMVLREARETGIGRLYLPLAFFLAPWQGCADRVLALSRRGTEVFAALPFILRQEWDGRSEGDIERVLFGKETQGVPVAGALVRNLEELAFLNERCYAGVIEADQGIPIWNRAALSFLAGQFDEWTLSPELRRREVGELLRAAGMKSRPGSDTPEETESGAPAENAGIVLYGRAAMMVSANCIRKTLGRCSGSGGWESFAEVLTDRMGRELPVTGDCRSCCNVIRNAVPTSLYRYREEIAELPVRRMRVDFTTETAQQVRQVLRGEFVSETTAGRFVHGVE